KYNILALISNSKYRVGFSGGKFNFNHLSYTLNPIIHKAESNYQIWKRAIRKFDMDVILDDDVNMPEYTGNKFFDDFDKNLVSIAPGSGILEKHKRWPVEKYIELTNKLTSQDIHVAILGGDIEKELADDIMKSAIDKDKIHNFVSKLSIKDTISVLHSSNVLVANCNGVSHMASLIKNISIIGIYGPTNYRITGPYTE
ncbi:TPA: glycosyltransferase family 9 protein, partial [Vibrio cholerae]